MDWMNVKDEAATAFKEGWDRAGREGCVTEALSNALQRDFGIHPDRVQQYMDDLLNNVRGKGSKPNPVDYRTAVVVPFVPRREP